MKIAKFLKRNHRFSLHCLVFASFAIFALLWWFLLIYGFALKPHMIFFIILQIFFHYPLFRVFLCYFLEFIENCVRIWSFYRIFYDYSRLSKLLIGIYNPSKVLFSNSLDLCLLNRLCRGCWFFWLFVRINLLIIYRNFQPFVVSGTLIKMLKSAVIGVRSKNNFLLVRNIFPIQRINGMSFNIVG